MKKIYLSLIAIVGGILSLKAQTADNLMAKDVAVPPNAAAFTKVTKVPVGEFTGIPEISVPLYKVKVDNLTIPVYLSYYAHGVQPNVHSGWVGTGWQLVADGVITRKINGIADEYCSDYKSNTPPAGGSEYGWYFGANHSQNYSLAQVFSNVLISPFGALTMTQVVDSAPDEFNFNFNGISGTFFLGSDGTWKIRSNQSTTLTIQETVGSVTINPLQNPTSEFNKQVINPTFIQFVITTGDGTKYIFGGNPSSGGNTTIDFNRRGPSSEVYNNDMVAMAWHISEVDLPSGKKIYYNYFRNGSQFTYNPYAGNTYYNAFYNQGGNTTLNGSNIDPVDFNLNITDPVYLSSIVFPEGRLVFNSAPSGENDLIEINSLYGQVTRCMRDAFNNYVTPATAPNIVEAFNTWYTYNDLANNYSYNAQGNITSIWYKLNDIELDDYNGKKLKDFQLTYTSDANTRLFLQSVQEVASNFSLPPYSFSYNTIALPPYCTLHTDHWGFYNGPKTFPTFALDANGFVTTTFQTQYYQYREPDPNYAQAGILTQINYPTGGYSQFFYETNQYQKWVNMPVSINQLPAPLYGGGIRVKKIISTDNANLTPITYEYSYVTDLTSNTCSGVLGMAKPIYAINDQSTYGWDVNGIGIAVTDGQKYSLWSTDMINTSQNDDGNVVTYSSVIERQSNNGVYNGMKVSVFANHDNNYSNNDPDAVEYTLDNATPALFHYSDRGFERGMLLTETTYDQNNNPVKIIQNTYNNDPNRFNQYVGAILCNLIYKIIPVPSESNNWGSTNTAIYYINNSAVRFYTYYPFLQQTVETDYASDHSGNSFATTTNYVYDHTNGTHNLVETSNSDSKGQLVTTSIKYPLDYNLNGITPTDVFSIGIQNLQQLKSVSLPVENTVQLSNADGSNIRTTSSFLNSFHATLPFPNLTYKAGIVNPANSFTTSSVSPQGSLIKDGTYEPRVYIDNFDGVGNVLQEHISGGTPQSYQWGYANNYLVATLKNAANTFNAATNTGVKDFFYDSFEEGDGNSTYGDAKTGHYSYNGAATPYSRSIANIDNGSYLMTYWQKNGGVWSWISQPVTITGSSYTINLTGQIDDVRLFPVAAEMTTYTYDILTGMTSSTDPKGEITFYEYDPFLRLVNIKDKDGNIVKHIAYNYASQSFNTDAPIVSTNVTGTAVSLRWTSLSTAASSSCYIQYTDLTTSAVYQMAITCGASGSGTISVPTAGHSYSFVIVQNLTAGGQLISVPTNVYVPTY